MAENQTSNRRFVFPTWANFVVPVLVFGAVASLPYLVLLAYTGLDPRTLDVGYRPEQPIPYSHKLHVSQLGLDCRYCHNTVEKASFAAIPPTSTCMNCHHGIHPDSPKLEPLFASFRTEMPVRWKKVHDLPDYSYFNHSAHVNKGVSCISCHGRVDHMDEAGVSQEKSLSMGWCLDCHREPAKNIRPTDQVTNLNWGFNLTTEEIAQIKGVVTEELGRMASAGGEASLQGDYQALAGGLKVGGKLSEEDRLLIGQALIQKHQVKTPQLLSDCSACHR